MSKFYHVCATQDGGTLSASAQDRHSLLMLNFTHWPDEERRLRVECQFGLPNDDARQLYQLLDRIYNPRFEEATDEQ